MAEIGGLIIPPNAKIQIDAVGAAPSATIMGSLEGTQSVSQEAVAQAHLPVPNVIGISARPAFTSQVPSTDTTGGNTYAHVQDGTGFQVGDTILVTTQNNAVPTQTSGVIKQITAANQGPVTLPQTNVGANLIIFGTFAFAPAANDIVELLPPAAIGGTVDVSDRAARLLGTIQGTVTVQEGASPPLWQAPNAAPKTINANIGAGGTVSIITFVVGQQLRLFGVAVTAGAGGPATFNDTGGIELGSVAAGATWAANFGGVFVFSAGGRGLDMKAPGAATTVNGMVSFSQG